MLSIREMLIERILFAATEEQLWTMYQVSASEIGTLTDLDLFELYENVTIELVAPEFIGDK
jgi:hypothetical protein